MSLVTLVQDETVRNVLLDPANTETLINEYGYDTAKLIKEKAVVLNNKAMQDATSVELQTDNKKYNINDDDEGIIEVKFDSLDDFFNNPKKFGDAKPEQFYKHLQSKGFNPQPLSDGKHAGKLYSEGGGFKVNWGGDRILEYHPAGLNHHGNIEYYKISSGPTGKMWFDLYGNPLK